MEGRVNRERDNRERAEWQRIWKRWQPSKEPMSNEMILAVSVLISIALFVIYVTVLHRVLR